VRGRREAESVSSSTVALCQSSGANLVSSKTLFSSTNRANCVQTGVIAKYLFLFLH
jgi:hypothetical protein